MSTINIDLAADTILNVMIGQQDENEVREVVFDFSGWYTTYGSGTISLAIQRPKDEWPYEGTLTVDSTNHKATWEISETDTAYAGTGQIQLSYKVGDAKKKSVVYRFTCHKSLGALGSVVTPVQIQTFIDEVEEALQTMDGKLDDMEDEITDVKADLLHLSEPEPITMVNGKYITMNGTTANVNSYMTTSTLPQYCAVVPCVEGDRFIITAAGGNASRAYGFVASNGTILEVASANTTVTNLKLIAPANTAYLVINDTSGATSYFLEKIQRRVTALETADTTFNIRLTNDEIRLSDMESAIMENVYDDVTANLTTVGNGYYNNPLVMGLTEWRNSEYTITYSLSINAGDDIIVTGYNYYGCRLVYFRGTSEHGQDIAYPDVVNTSQLYTKNFVAPYAGTLYIGTASAKTSNLSVKKAQSTKVLKPNVLDGLNGKTWLCMGDSITYNAGSYHEIIAEKTGVIPTNAGRTGTGYTKDSGGYSKFVTRISVITTVYDIFTIFGSINDTSFAQSDELIGNKADTGNNTYCGYVNQAIDAVYATGNNHLGIISPIPWNANGGNPTYNLSGRKMAQALKDICEYRGIPYLDLFRSSNMRPWESDFRTAYIPDGTHPNSAGYHLFANRIEAFIRSL